MEGERGEGRRRKEEKRGERGGRRGEEEGKVGGSQQTNQSSYSWSNRVWAFKCEKLAFKYIRL
jgi:hypothetical protein